MTQEGSRILALLGIMNEYNFFMQHMKPEQNDLLKWFTDTFREAQN